MHFFSEQSADGEVWLRHSERKPLVGEKNVCLHGKSRLSFSQERGDVRTPYSSDREAGRLHVHEPFSSKKHVAVCETLAIVGTNTTDCSSVLDPDAVMLHVRTSYPDSANHSNGSESSNQNLPASHPWIRDYSRHHNCKTDGVNDHLQCSHTPSEEAKSSMSEDKDRLLSTPTSSNTVYDCQHFENCSCKNVLPQHPLISGDRLAEDTNCPQLKFSKDGQIDINVPSCVDVESTL